MSEVNHQLKSEHKQTDELPASSAAGFTLLEVVIAMLLMLIGLLSLAGAVTYALRASGQGHSTTDAKLIITGTLEQIEALRNSKQLNYSQIANTGSVVNPGTYIFGGFSTGFNPVSSQPGCDGVSGTSDDLRTAGADGICGNADDVTDNSLALPGYTRQIEISQLEGNPNLKKVRVTLRYPGRFGGQQQLVGESYINNDARSNYLR